MLPEERSYIRTPIEELHGGTGYVIWGEIINSDSYWRVTRRYVCYLRRAHIFGLLLKSYRTRRYVPMLPEERSYIRTHIEELHVSMYLCYLRRAHIFGLLLKSYGSYVTWVERRGTPGPPHAGISCPGSACPSCSGWCSLYLPERNGIYLKKTNEKIKEKLYKTLGNATGFGSASLN